MIYLDNASTTYVYQEVVDIINECLTQDWGNPSNLYKFGLEARMKVESARLAIAQAINADPNEIIFTSCASESNALAISQYGYCVCSPYEHHDIKDNNKTIVKDNPEQIRGGVLYAHMFVNNETGEVFDIKNIVKEAHEKGYKVLVDSTQALGNVKIDVKEIDADYMSFSFHKVHAPKGIGALYVKEELLPTLKPLIYGSQEFTKRGGTQNVPYIAASKVAVVKAIKEMEEKNSHSLKLRQTLLNELNKYGIDYKVNEGKNNIPSILNISFKNATGDSLMLALEAYDIMVSTGSACNSGDLRPSEVLTAMNVGEEYIYGTLRFSFSLRNTEEEMVEVAKALNEIINR